MYRAIGEMLEADKSDRPFHGDSAISGLEAAVEQDVYRMTVY